METKTKDLIEKAKQIAASHGGSVRFSIEDNCPGDGWDGRLTTAGCYMLGNNHSEGEFFGWETEELQSWIEDIVDAVAE